MTINNFTEFNNLLNSAGLSNLSSIGNCVREYGVICSCKPHDKQNKLQECDRIYSQSISTIMANKSTLFNKIRESHIEFKQNNHTLATITR